MPHALVTGGNRGIGLAFVRALSQRGWSLDATARQPDAARTLADLATSSAGRVRVHPLDLAQPDAAVRLGESVGDVAIDLFISNAAMTGGPIGAFGAFDTDRFIEACRINAAGFALLVQAFADRVAASQRRTILAMSSRLGANPFYGYAEYFASKSALNALVMQAAVALRPRGVIVVAAHPGWVETEATQGQGKAPLRPDDAAGLLLRLADGLTLEHSGRFFDPDGSELPLVTRQTEIKFYSKPRDADR